MDKKYEIYRMKPDTYVQNGEQVFVRRLGDDKFFYGKIEDRGDDFLPNQKMYVRIDSGSLFCVRKTDCFFADKALREMIEEDSKPLDAIISDGKSEDDGDVGTNKKERDDKSDPGNR